MSGATVFDPSAVASASVSVEALPNPPRMPVVAVDEPGETTSRFEPRSLISELTCPWAPSPKPTVRITAAIPIRMPSMVSPDRSRCERTAPSPVRSVSSQLMRPPRWRSSAAFAGALCLLIRSQARS